MDGLLAQTLQVAVPMWIDRLKRKGGPDDDDWREVRFNSEFLGLRGDLVLHAPRPGLTADYFNRLAHAVAVLAFREGHPDKGDPGGFPSMGRWYNPDPPYCHPLPAYWTESAPG